ncbi:MAG TPA: 30S ribosomal protein S18 [Acidimicrobiaceae bacterium]|jgi:small subunit ribosomal protein S18|nr:30S ribosomal protein S18 [Acidimicrobiaceae bacterium]MAL67136.1 30S ribosomal protein S18 [Acidimicrobiaceae bacterium]MAM31434.1 30S ribosomal protein S18 [Acidimicrobiaceae bacterium]HAI64833.1 30S ribosomal protein S18 [Acidimicrobiaceae bacterium]HBH76190.1 30S ribosomal protein S18 [Acidimicrobiaceae bacterium]|tara:strand:- start:32 stop:499 length:468 start_codon:yes stop_codon:yes gene_type:complete
MAKVKKRGKPGQKNNDRGRKKKVSVLSSEKIEYVDWKDVNLLRRFVSERSKIRARRVNGNSTQQQKLVADAVKVAREMALIPYATRITTQRNNRGRDGERGDRGDRGPRAEGPAPRPSGPPPGADEDTGDEVISNEEAIAEVEGVTMNAADEGTE